MISITTVDQYIQNCPLEVQPKLQELRLIVKSLVPEAVEKISYAMPFYEYKGRLVYFGLQKHHIGLYIPPPIITQYSADLQGYQTTVSAVHLPVDKALPVALITTLVLARKAHNEAQK